MAKRKETYIVTFLRHTPGGLRELAEYEVEAGHEQDAILVAQRDHPDKRANGWTAERKRP